MLNTTKEEKCIDTLKDALKLYHEAHLIKYNDFIEDFEEFLCLYAPQYMISYPQNIIEDTEELWDLGDVIIITIMAHLKFWYENEFISAEKICDVIRWYLNTYQPSYSIISTNLEK